MKRLLLATTSLVAFWAAPAEAGPIVAAVAATAASAFAAGGIGALSFSAFGLSLTGGMAFAAQVLVRTALGYAMSALSGSDTGTKGEGGYTVSALGAASPTAFIYGQVRIGGIIFYQETTGAKNKYLHQCVAIADHEIEEFTSIYLNDEELTLDGDGVCTAPAKYANIVRVKEHLGADDQVADVDLVSESEQWTSDHKASGIAYLYVRFTYSKDKYPNGIPDISCLVKGKKVLDTRSATTAYSANPAMCLRDYLITAKIATASEIDTTSFEAAANICDESVNLSAGGTESRYECHGTQTTKETPTAVINDMLSSMAGMIWYSQGLWGCKAGSYSAPALTLTTDDMRSGLSVSPKPSRRDGFNRVTGLFRGPETNWQPTNFPEVTSATFLAEDGGLDSANDMTLQFTTSVTMAQRIAKIALYRNRQGLRVSGMWGMEALPITVGDIIALTDDYYGFSAKPFEVIDWSFGITNNNELGVNMSLQEISSEVFDWNAEEAAFNADNASLLSPYDVPVLGLNWSSELRVITEHLSNVVSLDVTSQEGERISRIEVEYKLSSDSTWISAGTGQVGIYTIIDTQDGTYDFRARAINTLGVIGDYTTLSNQTIQGLTDPPEDVTNFYAAVNGGVVSLKWTPVSDLDLSHYKIRYAPEFSGVVWSDSVSYIDKVPRPADSVVVPARGGTYMIRAVDKTGSQSVNVASAVITADNLEGFAGSQTLTDSTTFTGSKTNTFVSSGELRLGSASITLWDSLAGNVDDLTGNFDDLGLVETYDQTSGEYEFSTYIDLTTDKRARISVDVTSNRIDTDEGLWDDLQGQIDSKLGLFDSLIGGTDQGDTDVIAYYAYTSDDPAGTPTWSSWVVFQSADVYARAFKFKIGLTSEFTGVTPSVTALTAKAYYN